MTSINSSSNANNNNTTSSTNTSFLSKLMLQQQQQMSSSLAVDMLHNSQSSAAPLHPGPNPTSQNNPSSQSTTTTTLSNHQAYLPITLLVPPNHANLPRIFPRVLGFLSRQHKGFMHAAAGGSSSSSTDASSTPNIANLHAAIAARIVSKGKYQDWIKWIQKWRHYNSDADSNQQQLSPQTPHSQQQIMLQYAADAAPPAYPCHIHMYRIPSQLPHIHLNNVIWINWDLVIDGIEGFPVFWEGVMERLERESMNQEAQSERQDNKDSSSSSSAINPTTTSAAHFSPQKGPFHVLLTITNTQNIHNLMDHYAHRTTAEQQDVTNHHYATFFLRHMRKSLQNLKTAKKSRPFPEIASVAFMYLHTNEDWRRLNECFEWYHVHSTTGGDSTLDHASSSPGGQQTTTDSPSLQNLQQQFKDSDPFNGVFIPPQSDSLAKIANLDYHLVLNHFSNDHDMKLSYNEVFTSALSSLSAGGGIRIFAPSNNGDVQGKAAPSGGDTPSLDRTDVLDFNEYLAEKHIVTSNSKPMLHPSASSSTLLGTSRDSLGIPSSRSGFNRSLKKNNSSSALLSTTASKRASSSDKLSSSDSKNSLSPPASTTKRSLRKTLSRPVLHQQAQAAAAEVETPSSALGNMQQEEAELFFSSMLSHLKKGKK